MLYLARFILNPLQIWRIYTDFFFENRYIFILITIIKLLICMDIKEKIQQYLDFKGINTNQLEISIGVSKSYWRKTKSISANIVMEISRIYTDLNLEWLFRDDPQMIRKQSQGDMIQGNNIISKSRNSSIQASKDVQTEEFNKFLLKELSELREQNKMLLELLLKQSK